MDCEQSEDVWTCQDCGGLGDKHEVISNTGGDTPWQIWIYCDACKVETFYDLPDVE